MPNTNYDIAKKNYDRGMWTASMLEKLVERGKLTQAEYEDIIRTAEE